jgi:hypothetical protein
MISECDLEIEKYLTAFEFRIDPYQNQPPNDEKGMPQRVDSISDLGTHLHRIMGTDLTLIDGVNVTTANIFMAEVGPDISKFPTVNHFCSWLGLCPQNKISGGKILSSRTRPGASRMAQALRMAANGLHNSNSYLGNFLRRMKARHGAPKAITATAHKLARIIYHLVRNGKSFDESVFAEHEKQHKKRLKRRIRIQAKALGFQLVPCD